MASGWVELIAGCWIGIVSVGILWYKIGMLRGSRDWWSLSSISSMDDDVSQLERKERVG